MLFVDNKGSCFFASRVIADKKGACFFTRVLLVGKKPICVTFCMFFSDKTLQCVKIITPTTKGRGSTQYYFMWILGV